MTNYYARETTFSSVKDTWTTPKKIFDALDKEFNFTLDAAALSNSALCEMWYGPDHDDPLMQDAFSRLWYDDVSNVGGTTAFLNPPYGKTIKHWMAKADSECRAGLTIVCLVPSRTDTSWWHESIIHHEVRFVRGRLHFGGADRAPFPSAIVVMRPIPNPQ